MKRILIICYAVLLFAYSAPFLGALVRRHFFPEQADIQTVTLLTDQGETSLGMTEYLLGVVSAEMPASFEPEALKAQTVAARSYTLYCVNRGKHNGGKLCTDPGCCQAYLSDRQMRLRWGTGYEKYRRKILEAVEATEGEYLNYMGAPAEAVFHSSSAPVTESSENIWSYVPYLVSVPSPERAENVPDYISYVRLSPEELKSAVLFAHPEAVFPEDAAQWLGEIRRDSSGRVESLELGGASLSGREVRNMFLLRSTAFVPEFENGDFLFTVVGFGHGVGMSQYGANVMAQNGADYASILAHYYPGTTLSRPEFKEALINSPSAFAFVESILFL